MTFDDDLIPSDEDVKLENELADMETDAEPEGDALNDSPQHEDTSDALHDETAGDTPEADQQPVDEQPPRKQSATSKRFQDLANKARAAEERAREAEEALQFIQQQSSDDDYDEFDTDSIIRRSSHETAKVIQEQQVMQARKEAARFQQEQVAAKVQEFSASENEFAAKVPDYYESVKALNDIPHSGAVAELIIDSDKGPELAYYLAKHPNEAREVVNMSPIAAAKFIGGIEARLTASPAKTTTNAPKPPPKVTGRSAANSKDPNSMTQEEYEKWRQG